MPDHFKILKDELPIIETLATTGGVNGFFGQEVLRFHSIAGTLLENFNCGKNANINDRHITHILARSLIENYFWLIYIFDDSNQKENRYQEVVNSFKRDYHKLINEKQLSHKKQLEPTNSTWANLPKPMDLNSIMAQIKNDYGNNLNYLYSIYRISSFDTHGKNLENITKEAFGKVVNFPILDISKTFDLISNQYLVTLQKLRDTKEI